MTEYQSGEVVFVVRGLIGGQWVDLTSQLNTAPMTSDEVDESVDFLKSAVQRVYADDISAQITVGDTVINVSKFDAISFSTTPLTST